MWVTSRQMTTRMRHFSQLILKPPNGEREEKRLNPVGEVRVRVFLKVQWGVSSLFCNTRREFAFPFRRRRWVRASKSPFVPVVKIQRQFFPFPMTVWK